MLAFLFLASLALALMTPAVVGVPAVGDAFGVRRSLREILRSLVVMMAALTNYCEDQIAAHLFRTASFTKPTHQALALFTAAPGEAGGGTEVSGGSYARVDVPPLDANWAATSGGNGTTSNVADATFPAPTANWGVVISTATFDATTSGNMLLYGSLTTSKTINNGDAAPKFSAGSFQAVFD